MTASHVEALKIAQSALWQYVSDLQNPPTGDSLARRIAAAKAISDRVDAALAQQEVTR